MLVYLDNAATTQVCPQAARAALEVMTEGFGNPSSRCAWGGRAAARLKEDRQTVADALGCAPEELFFTSCGAQPRVSATVCRSSRSRAAARPPQA